MKTTILFLMASALLAGCTPPHAVSDAQVSAVTARCKELGMATRVFNSVSVSTAECIPVATVGK